MTETTLSILDVEPSQCLLVGDRLETDVAMGRSAGMTTGLVLTGVTDRDDLAGSDVTPDIVAASFAELVELLCEKR